MLARQLDAVGSRICLDNRCSIPDQSEARHTSINRPIYIIACIVDWCIGLDICNKFVSILSMPVAVVAYATSATESSHSKLQHLHPLSPIVVRSVAWPAVDPPSSQLRRSFDVLSHPMPRYVIASETFSADQGLPRTRPQVQMRGSKHKQETKTKIASWTSACYSRFAESHRL